MGEIGIVRGVQQHESDPRKEESMPTVLVVEDQEDIQSLLKDVLGEIYRIIQVTTGGEALLASSRRNPT